MRRGRRERERQCGCAPTSEVTEQATVRASPPWWQGAWQALGGLFNLLAALAGRWPRHGS